MSKIDKKNLGVADLKYRPLKKLIKRNFKSIISSVGKKQLPTAPLIDDFMAQAKAMVSYSGFGDDHYVVFITACESMHEAFLKKDIALFAKRVQEISSIKKDCHHRYKS